MTELRFPELAGEERATVLKWLCREGGVVEEGDELVELLADKASFTIPAPAAGRLSRIVAAEGAAVAPGELLGEISG